jgi:prophage tail gpP-like protein
MEVDVYVEDQLVLKGYIETVAPDIDAERAEVSITGKDKAGDLVDCAAAPEGPAEFHNVKLEEVIKRIAAPFGLSARSEIDTGQAFPRFGIDLSETGLSAIEKGARQRHALVMSDGVGGIVATRSGKTRAPAALILPGNVKSASGQFTHKDRHSKVIVRGQSEKAATARDGRAAPLTGGGTPSRPEDRKPSDGSATERERRGVTATGIAEDDEVKRYRPIVHLAKSKADEQACADEADWRMRTKRGESEELTYRVHGYSVLGRLWRVNQIVPVDDAFLDVHRDMLISRVTYRYDDGGRDTEIAVTSPEAFDKQPVKGRRKNLKGRTRMPGKKSSGSGPLDGTASAL